MSKQRNGRIRQSIGRYTSPVHSRSKALLIATILALGACWYTDVTVLITLAHERETVASVAQEKRLQQQTAANCTTLSSNKTYRVHQLFQMHIKFAMQMNRGRHEGSVSGMSSTASVRKPKFSDCRPTHISKLQNQQAAYNR